MLQANFMHWLPAALILELHELLMVVLQYRNRKEDCMDNLRLGAKCCYSAWLAA